MSQQEAMECAAQGEEFLKEAEKKTKKKMFKKPKWREALSLYNKAAAQFQLASMYDRVAETYLTMAEMVETQLADENSTKYYIDSAKFYMKDNEPDEAVKVYRLAVSIFGDEGKMISSANLHVEIAKILVKQKKLDGAIEEYNNAIDLYIAGDKPLKAQEIQAKLASLYVQEWKWDKAIEHFEQLAKANLKKGDMNGRTDAQRLYFKCCLVRLVKGIREKDTTTFEAGMNKYKGNASMFENCNEGKLMQNIWEAFEDGDVQTFTNHIYKFSQVQPFDDWTSKLLLVIKEAIKDGFEADEVGGGGDDGVDEIDLS